MTDYTGTVTLDFTGEQLARAPRTVVTCPACGVKRMASDGPHAPHFRAGALVDCVGQVLRPAPRLEVYASTPLRLVNGKPRKLVLIDEVAP
jgi:hypothetical protein